MANHDFLFAYSDELEEGLRKYECMVPRAQKGNRWPTKEECVRSVVSEGLIPHVDGDFIYVLPPEDAPAALDSMARITKFVDVQDGKVVESTNRSPLTWLVLIECRNWEELNHDPLMSITMRGNFPLELFLVQRLTETCGQLTLWPDTGDPPVVVELGSDTEMLANAWLASVEAGESWADFYVRIERNEP